VKRGGEERSKGEERRRGGNREGKERGAIEEERK
jgi:hypothetical protein